MERTIFVLFARDWHKICDDDACIAHVSRSVYTPAKNVNFDVSAEDLSRITEVGDTRRGTNLVEPDMLAEDTGLQRVVLLRPHRRKILSTNLRLLVEGLDKEAEEEVFVEWMACHPRPSCHLSSDRLSS